MALEAVIYSLDPFSYGPPPYKEHYYYGQHGFLEENNNCIINSTTMQQQQQLDGSSSYYWDCCSPIQPQSYANNHSSSPELYTDPTTTTDPAQLMPTTGGGGLLLDPPLDDDDVVASSSSRRKRRRSKSNKDKEEIESQRMTHIAVERNRRKQMNDYLAVLRSLMPTSYVQRGDQASIIGGAINFVKELEQLLQAMKAQKPATANARHLPFSEFFTFPQYSTTITTTASETRANNCPEPVVAGEAESDPVAHNFNVAAAGEEAVGDIEVTMVESHASVKILTRKQPRQLLKLVAGIQSLRLTILHLNVTTTADQMVLYSVSVKLEEGCHLNTVDEVATAVNQMLRRIKEEAEFS